MINSFTKAISDSEIKFYQSLQNNPHFDFILFPQKIEQGIASFKLLESGNLIGADKKYYLLSMEAMAKFHHFSSSLKFDFLAVDKNYYSQSLQNVSKILSSEQNQTLQNSLNLINNNWQIIHDDFLPQNVLIDDDNIKIIDWENIRFGFAEHDIGRFLGDLDCKDPQWNKKYYPLEWHDELKQKYLSTRYQLDPRYNTTQGSQLITFGEMWNYLGPIETCPDKNSQWFKANLEAFQHIINL